MTHKQAEQIVDILRFIAFIEIPVSVGILCGVFFK